MVEKKYWMNLNNQSMLYFDLPLNPGFIFWIKRNYRARVCSDGGERVTVTRQPPFNDKELEEIYLETEHRQQI
ncbi:U-exon protein, partial [Southern Psittacara leucophthalmus aviadenovirus]